MTPTPYYDHGGITIYHGDCRVILPLLGTFDLVLTDPPYGVALDTRNKTRQRGTIGRPGAQRIWTSRDHDFVHGDDEPFDPAPLLQLAPRHILWGANNYASKLPDSPCWLAWDRKCERASDSNITDCELAAVLGHRFKTVRLFRHMWAGFQRDSEVGERILHPTQKPVALMAWCLSFFPDVRTVIDPYMGSGPIARACKDAGKRYVGIEFKEHYCRKAVKRLAQEVLTFSEVP
jgi:DNA modification methylase